VDSELLNEFTWAKVSKRYEAVLMGSSHPDLIMSRQAGAR
jgi:hypothetical protein